MAFNDIVLVIFSSVCYSAFNGFRCNFYGTEHIKLKLGIVNDTHSPSKKITLWLSEDGAKKKNKIYLIRLLNIELPVEMDVKM
jgi:hypothetical protein